MVVQTRSMFSRNETQKTTRYADHAKEGTFIQLFSHADVHTYLINTEEAGFIRRDTTTVKIVMIPKQDQTTSYGVVIPPAFLEAGGWFYPLIPSKTPVYRTEEKYYIFPDFLSSSSDASFGIVFYNISTEERELFENILLNLAGLDEFPTSVADKFGNPGELITTIDAAYGNPMETQFPTKAFEDVGAGIIMFMNAAGVAVDFISVGANRTFEFISFETGEAKFNLSSNYHGPEEHMGVAVEVSGYGISRLADATSNLATFTSHNNSSAASSGMNLHTVKQTTVVRNGVIAFTGGAMSSVGIVYETLYNAGQTLAYAITHNHVIEHRYGARRSEHIMEYGPKSFVTAIKHH